MARIRHGFVRFSGLLILSILLSPAAQACRFNIREVGFAYFPEDSYFLVGLVDDHTPAVQVTAMEEATQSILAQSNIEFELIRIDQQKDHPALPHLPMKEIVSWPALVLVSPASENRMKILPIPQSDQPFSQRLQRVLHDLILSPKREEILEHVADVYGFVLLFHGRDQEQNDKAGQLIDTVIGEATEMLPYLPQPMNAPAPLKKGPHRIDISLQEAQQEEMLLWSLDLLDRDPNAPYVVVMHGRGRIVGVPLTGAKIQERTLRYFLSIIGADCECGLDRRWMQGPMIPLRWDTSVKARLARGLGYDPENPTVMMEIARILRRGYYYPDEFSDSSREANPPQIPGYQEITIVSENEPNRITLPMTPEKLDMPTDLLPKQSSRQNVQDLTGESATDMSFLAIYRIPLIIGSIVVSGILIIGILIGLRNRGRAA